METFESRLEQVSELEYRRDRHSAYRTILEEAEAEGMLSSGLIVSFAIVATANGDIDCIESLQGILGGTAVIMDAQKVHDKLFCGTS